VEVRSIGRQEFHRLYPYTGELTGFIGEGAEWFTDDARSVVGIIARPAAQPTWKYAVLKRSRSGDLRVRHVGEVNGDLQTTRDACRRAMTAMNLLPKQMRRLVPSRGRNPSSRTEAPWLFS